MSEGKSLQCNLYYYIIQCRPQLRDLAVFLIITLQGEHGEAGGGEEYSQLRHGRDPHAVPNPVDPNYSHLKEVQW